jgi:hypothetical protein
MQDAAESDWSVWHPLVKALNSAFAVEDSERPMLRKLLAARPAAGEAQP